MKNYEQMEHCAVSEQIVNVLMNKTQNFNPLFFRVMVAYYMAKVASMMRVKVKTHDRGEIPVNLYALNLAPSGFSKGFSTNIVEDQIIAGFRTRFTNETFKSISDKNIAKVAVERAAKYGIDDEEALAKTIKEFESLGALVFAFDSGTTAAVKQMRQKLLLANAGSVNFEMDEIGSNLLGNIDVLNTFLELYDVGKVKQKLTKNTKDNTRVEEMFGNTPTNMMLFGTPDKLLTGKVEEEFYSMLETGYARRCFFGFSKAKKNLDLTPEQIYDLTTDTQLDDILEQLSDRFTALADQTFFNKKFTMSKQVALLIIEYRLNCERLAEELKDHETLLKAEMSHRYFKALKLAGAYAFVEGNSEITEDNVYAAIKLAEESGEAFRKILTRDRNYEKLAKYLSNIGREVTQVDLVEELGFYKGSEAQRRELLNLAIAYGYRNNIVIKKTYSDGIEFLIGESMNETNLDNLIVAYSHDITKEFQNERAPWERLYELVTLDNYHYTAHHFREGYRTSSNMIEGFNLVIIDVDSGISLELAKKLLGGFKALYATTKRHTDENNRFRIILPLSHLVKLNQVNYSKFMKNVFAWLPFKVDEQTSDPARKWCTHNGHYEYVDGELLDAMLFIPETKKQEEQSQKILDAQGLTNLERWFLNNTSTGSRSNMMIRYAYALIDQGYTVNQVNDAVYSFNKQLKDPISEEELHQTIFISVAKEIARRELNKHV